MNNEEDPSYLKDGYIYFIQTQNSDGYIKIGFEGILNSRLSALQVGNPYKLKYIAQLPYRRWMEGELHDIFRDDWISGEWHYHSAEITKCLNAIADGSFEKYFFKTKFERKDKEFKEKETEKLKNKYSSNYEEYLKTLL